MDLEESEKCRQLFRLHLRGTVHQWTRSRLRLQKRQAWLRRCQAHPASAAEYQCLHFGRALGQSQDHHASDLHRRLVAADQGSGSHQQHDRSGRRRHYDACRQPQSGGANRGQAWGHGVRLSLQPSRAGATDLPHRSRVELDRPLSEICRHVDEGRDHPQLLSRWG